MHFNINNSNTVYKFGDTVIKAKCDIKDLDVFVSNNFKNSFHCYKLRDKTKSLCSMIFRCLKSCDPNVFVDCT